MKALALKLSLVLFAVSGYIASPFITAWWIREAVHHGDSAYLARQIDWPSVRASLAPDISRIALSLPDPDTSPAAKPSLWQRFKAYWGQGAVNRAIESYVTPEGLPQLFQARKAYRDYIAGQPDDARLAIVERIRRAWARVKRAQFTSLTTFEIDMADKHDPSRVYLGKLGLDGFGWKLKELRIKVLQSAEDAAVKFAETGGSIDGRSFWERARAAAR